MGRRNRAGVTRSADVLVAVVSDVGTNRRRAGERVGDVDAGPVSTALLPQNTVASARS